MTIVNEDRKKKAAGIGVLIALALALWARAKARAQLPPIQYTCPYCGLTFPTQAELDKHIATVHPSSPPIVLYATLYGYVSSFRPPILPMPMEGVLVEVVDTGLFTYTGRDGKYLISEIPPGTYTIRFSYPSYQVLEKTVQLKGGVAIKLDVGLTPTGRYVCPYCGMSFLTQAELDNHIRTNHPTPVPVPAGIAWASIWPYIVIAYCWNANNKCWDRVFEGTTLTSGMECSIMVNQDCVLEYLGLRYELKVEGTGRGAGEGWNIFTWDLPQYYLAE